MNKKFKYFIIIIIILIIIFGIYLVKNNINIIKTNNTLPEIKINYNDFYNDFVKTLDDKKLYILETDEFKEIGTVSKNTILSLTKDDNISKGYFKLKNMDYYIDYKDLAKSDEEIINDFWKKYIPYNESIKTDVETNLYQNDNLVYSIKEGMTLPIIIKENDSYGVIYKDELYYVNKDDVNKVENNNTDLSHTNGISALVYHATYDSNNQEEKKKCINANATICLSDIQFNEQMNYLVEHNYYTATMKDLEMFIDGKIQLPEHTVVITIDDGYFLSAAVKVLEKYNLHATLFLIGELANLDEWKTDAWYSKSIELHSHTYNMHNPNICPGGQGSALKCLDKNILLEDLKKSREQLNGSTVFCYPFFEYNDYAINVLKEAGFTMAFAGGRKKIRVGSNKMTLPRYGIINTSNLNDFIRVIS